jgi:hypothetical protein
MGVGQDRGVKGGESVVLEQRVSNFVQSMLVGLCLFISPVIELVPRAVLWGYFIFMATESFPGNQFVHRVTLAFMDMAGGVQGFIRGIHGCIRGVHGCIRGVIGVYRGVQGCIGGVLGVY